MCALESYHYSHTIGFFAMGGRGFNNPMDVALGRNDILYVINRGGSEDTIGMNSKGVTVCTVSGEFVGRFSSGGVGDGQMIWPVSIALDEDQNIYICDEFLQRVSIFNSEWEFVDKWGVRGSGKGEFDGPAGIAFQDGDLLVADAHNSRIQRYSKDGRFLGSWGKPGDGQGEFNMPWGIATDKEGCVYVADWRNDRVQKFDPNGRYLAKWGTSGSGDGQFHRPAGVAVDPDGYIYVADWANERVQVLRADGSFVVKLRGESGVSQWGMEYFVANPIELEARNNADMEVSQWVAGSAAEESSGIEKLFWGPTSVKVDDKGRMFVLESCRYRIQIYVKGS